ncbi:MAG: hypothetical protein ACP5NB_00300 [Chloroflexia bacterium]
MALLWKRAMPPTPWFRQEAAGTVSRPLAWAREAFDREVRLWGRTLGDPFLGFLLLGTLLLLFLAGQVGPPLTLEVGERPDEMFLSGFYEPERVAGSSFRWSTGEGRLDIPALGSAPYRLNLRLAAPRPAGTPPPLLSLIQGGHLLLETTVEPVPQVYSLLLPAEALSPGNLALEWRCETFSPGEGDPRMLGVVLDRLEVWRAGRPLALLPPETYLWPLAAVLLTVLLARRLGWPRQVALGAGAAGALVLAALLAWTRPFLAPGLALFPLTLACSYLLHALFRKPLHRLLTRSGGKPSLPVERALWSVVLFFLAVRLAGALHPAMETWDLCFHFHRLQDVARGEPFFTIVSGEWRGLQTLYLPSLYLVLAPFWAVFGGRLVPLQVAAVLLDTSAALPVAYLAGRLLGWGRATWLAPFLYLTLPQSYIIFSWGVVANIFGQWLLLLLLAFLFSPAGRLSRRPAWMLAAALLTLGLLSHPGTVLLTAALLGGWFFLAWWLPRPGGLPRPAVGRWAGAALGALGLVTALYYSHFVPTMWESLQAMGQGSNLEQPRQGGILVRGPVIDPELGLQAVEVSTWGEAVLAGGREVAAEARAYYDTWPLLLALAALPGLAGEQRAPAVRLLGLAFTTALFFAIIGLALNLYVRYMYFLLPFVALGAAWWPARWSRRGRAGRLTALLAGLYLLFLGLSFWAGHVLYYSAGCR